MIDKPQFDDMLARYVFAVAAKVIDLASEKDQTRLVELLVNTDPMTAPNTGTDLHATQRKATRPTTSVFEKLEQQWESALTEPITEDTIKRENRRAVFQRLKAFSQQEINDHKDHITKMQMLIDRANDKINDERIKGRLIAHYQRIKENYAVRLIQLQTFQEISHNKTHL